MVRVAPAEAASFNHTCNLLFLKINLNVAIGNTIGAVGGLKDQICSVCFVVMDNPLSGTLS